MLNESDEVKEVYAVFGLAVYAGQCLEHELVNTMMFLKFIPEKGRNIRNQAEWEHDIDAFYAGHFRKTLGQMIAAFKNCTTVPDDLMENLSTALERRNWLSHHYFRERAADFLFSNGRKKMITELQEAVALIQAADQRLGNFKAPLLKRYGISKEKLQEAEAQMLKGKEDEYASVD